MGYYYSDRFLTTTFNNLIKKYPTKLINGKESAHLKQYMGFDKEKPIYCSLKEYPNYIFIDHALLIISGTDINKLFYTHFKECRLEQQEFKSLFKRQVRSFITRPLGQFTDTYEIPTDHFTIFHDILNSFLNSVESSGIENIQSYVKSVSVKYPKGFDDNLLSLIEKNKSEISFEKQSVKEAYDNCYGRGAGILEKMNLKNNEKFILDDLNTENFLFHIDDFVFLIPNENKSISFRLMQYYKSLGENIEGDIINLPEIYNTKLKDYYGKIENKCLKELFALIEESNLNEINKLKSSEGSGTIKIYNGILNFGKDNDFELLLNKYEKEITDIDSKYVLYFVRLNSYLKAKSRSLKNINDRINETSSLTEYEKYIDELKRQYESLEQTGIFSLIMITSLLDKKMIAFYTVYEKFDQIGIFETNFEKELLKSLEKINESIISVVDSINRLEINLRIGLIEMGMNIASQIADTSHSIDKRLSSIGSDLKFNNLLTAINTYQLSK